MRLDTPCLAWIRYGLASSSLVTETRWCKSSELHSDSSTSNHSCRFHLWRNSSNKPWLPIQGRDWEGNPRSSNNSVQGRGNEAINLMITKVEHTHRPHAMNKSKLNHDHKAYSNSDHRKSISLCICPSLASLFTFSLFKKKKRPCTCFFAETNEYNSKASNHLQWCNQFLGLIPNPEQVHASIKENKNGLLPAPKLPPCFLLLSAPQACIVPKIAASSGAPCQIC